MTIETPTRTPPGTLPVRLVAWGASESDVERAINEAGSGWSRKSWEITSIERLTGVPCPLPQYDPKSLASGAGYDWAYAAFRADR